MRILAIDQGTTSTRAVAVGEDGGTELRQSLAHRQIYPRPGWVEHDPEELLANVTTCLEDVAPGTLAVGLDNQGESCLAWDRQTGEALSPVIVWQDERTRDITEGLRAEGVEALTLSRAGLPLDPYFSASKLGWLMRELPEVRRRAAAGRLCLGTTDAFFRHRLTGRCETDVATASRTSLMALSSCAWDAELCEVFGVPVDCLPTITDTSGDLGELPGGLPLVSSIVDQQAALRGHGCAAPGDAKITFGTGAFGLAIAGADLPRSNGGPLPTVAWRGPGATATYALDGGVYAAGAAVNWARGLGLFDGWDDINAFEAASAADRGVIFVPALAGLACPHWDRRARGAWMGLGLDTDRSLMVQAVLEGIAFRTAEVIAAMDALQPIGPEISIDGGMTRNPWFCQFLADCLGRSVAVSDEPELTALGTAALAAEAIGGKIDLTRRPRTLAPRPQPGERAARFAAAREQVQAMGRVTPSG